MSQAPPPPDPHPPRRGRPLALPAALALLVALYVAVDVAWIARNSDYIQFDVVYHLDEAADLRNLLQATWATDEGVWRKLRWSVSLLNNQAGSHLMWPRMVYAVSTLWGIVLGGGERAPFYANVPFLLLAVAGITLTTLRLVEPRRSLDRGRPRSSEAWEIALIAVALCLSYPGTYGPLRLYSQYYPLACCLPLCLWLLMKTEGFGRRWWALACGAFAGWTVLVKSLLAFYMAAPLLYAGWMVLRRLPAGVRPRPGVPARAAHALLALIPALALSYLWLFGSVEQVIQEMLAHVAPSLVPFPGGFPKPHFEPYAAWSWPWLTYYLRVAVANLGLHGAAGLLLGAAALIRWRARLPAEGRHDRRLLLLFAVGAPLALTVVSSKEARFLVPMYPLWAMVTALGLAAAGPVVRRVAAVALLVVGTGTFWMLSFEPDRSWMIHDELRDALGEEEGDIWARPPRPEPFPGLVDTVAGHLAPRADGRPPKVAFLSVPHGGYRFNYCIDLVRIEAVRFKARQPFISRAWNPFFDPEAVALLGELEVVDMRFFPPDYFETEALDLDLLVIFHWYQAYLNFDPPYINQAGDPMPDLVFSRSHDEIARRLPPGFERLATYHFSSPAYKDPAYVYVYRGPGGRPAD